MKKLIEKRENDDLQIAISQRLLVGANHSSLASFKLIMPFLSINKSRVKLVNIKHPQSNGLKAEVWSQAGRNIPVSKTIINQSQLYHQNSQQVSNNAFTLDINTKQTVQHVSEAFPPKIIEKEESVFQDEMVNRLEPQVFLDGVKQGESSINKKTHFNQGLVENIKPGKNYLKSHELQPDLALRPLLFNKPVKPAKFNKPFMLKENLMLSKAGVSLSKKNRSIIKNTADLSFPSKRLASNKKNELNKEIGEPSSMEMMFISEQNHSRSTKERLDVFDANLENGEVNKKIPVNHLGTDADFPKRKAKRSTINISENMTQSLPPALHQKLESVIEKKLELVLKGKEKKLQNDKELLIQSVSNELKGHLSSSKIISDDFIRLVAKKLNKSIQESRFRMGLIS